MVETLVERKTIRKTKEGKKRMRQIGSVEVPQEAFLTVLKYDEDNNLGTTYRSYFHMEDKMKDLSIYIHIPLYTNAITVILHPFLI